MRLIVPTLIGLLLAASLTSATAAAAPPRMCSDLTSGPFTVEVLGDSVGAGTPGASNNSRRWQTRLSSQLPAGNSVWNGAVPGAQVRDYLSGGQYRYHTQFTLNVKPSLVILVFRINDQWMSKEQPVAYSPTVFQAQMLQLVGEIQAASPSTTVMLGVAPWVLDTRIDTGPYGQWDFIVALWNVYVSTGAVWMDWMRMLPKQGQPNDEGLLTYDLVHPSDTGQAVIAAHTYEAISSYCRGVQ